MGRVDGKVALVTGAARGQGRSHAVRLAQEGADVIAVDICHDIDGVDYPMGTSEELAETVEMIERLDRRALPFAADVRDPEGMREVVEAALAEVGAIDIVAANAGISDTGMVWEYSTERWETMLGINLTGVWNTVKPVIPPMIAAGRGGSIVITSSLAGSKGLPSCGPYTAAKFGVVGLTQTMAAELGPHRIRVNSVHPTNVNTGMIMRQGVYHLFCPDVPADRDVTMEEFEVASSAMNLLPIPYVEPVDISNAVLWLASDEARYVTGIQLPVDAGAVIK